MGKRTATRTAGTKRSKLSLQLASANVEAQVVVSQLGDHRGADVQADPVLSALTNFVVAADFDTLPDTVVHAVPRLLIDALGCAYGAWHGDAPTIARRLARSQPLNSGATVIGSMERSTPELAAFANTTMVRYLDYNDTYATRSGAGHPSDFFPGVLAAAEVTGASGRDALVGMVVAYEAFAALLDALNVDIEPWDHVYFGSIATAAGAAAAMQLKPDQVSNAISLATVSNLALSVTRKGALSMWKSCAAANAVRNAVFAVTAAAEGLTGPLAPFVGQCGVIEVLGGNGELHLPREPDSFALTRAHVKRFPAGFVAQTAIEAALEIRSGLADRGLELADIDRIEVGTFAFAYRVMAGDQEKWCPQTRETADHSLPYVLALALQHGTVKVDHFGIEYLRSSDLADLMAKVQVSEDMECNSAWPEGLLTKLHVRYRSGQSECVSVRYHRGHAMNPMTDADIEQKFRAQADPLLTAAEQARLLGAVWGLAETGSVSELLATTVGAACQDL